MVDAGGVRRAGAECSIWAVGRIAERSCPRSSSRREVVAIDADPVLLAIGRGALGGLPSCSSLMRTCAATGCMRSDAGPLRCGGFDDGAALARSRAARPSLYALAGMLRPGAVFLDGDRLDFDHDQRTIATRAHQIRPEWPDAPDGAEDYDAWWDAAVAEPALAREVVEREQRWQKHPHEDESPQLRIPPVGAVLGRLRRGGTLWQHLANGSRGDALTGARHRPVPLGPASFVGCRASRREACRA